MSRSHAIMPCNCTHFRDFQVCQQVLVLQGRISKANGLDPALATAPLLAIRRHGSHDCNSVL